MELWFGTVTNNEVFLSEFGKIAEKNWREIPLHFPYVELDEFIVMPNHIHGIIIIKKNLITDVAGTLHATSVPRTSANSQKDIDATSVPQSYADSQKETVAVMAGNKMVSITPKSGSLSVIVRSYKSAVSNHIHKIDGGFSWQPGFYDNIICTNGQLSRIRKYILTNPENWNISD
jgi:REP element-mobilizing transposase RayT